MFELSEEKQKVLDAHGNVLVMGGPGSGKTTIALLKAQYMINKGILKPGQKILFLSFARATISRVEQHAKNVIEATDASALEITTYHGFIWTILRSHGYLLSPHRIRLLSPHDASARLSAFESDDERRAEKTRLFADEGLLHFDLFASTCVKLLSKSKKLSAVISNKYPIIFADEFQDTNKDEWELISHLGIRSSLIALADPDQRIYDFRGADPARIKHFIEEHRPHEFDFGMENNRSNGTDIVVFGNDLLTGKNKGKKYENVKIHLYPPRKGDAQLLSIKSHVLARLKEKGDDKEWSLAILVPSNRLMISVSDVLGKRNPCGAGRIMPAIAHEVAVDVAGPALMATFIAKLLELSSQSKCCMEDIVFSLCDHILGCKGDKAATQTDQDAVNALLGYIDAKNYEKAIRGKIRQQVIDDCKAITELCNGIQFSGEVAADWIKVRSILSECSSKYFKKAHEDAMFIKLLHKGSLLNHSLAQIWRTNGNYIGAADAVKNALAQEHFATSTKTWSGINVMTIHKAKGKEFDEVIIYEGPHTGRFIVNDDLDKARLVLRVAVTRAKKHAFILTSQYNPCPLL